MSLMLGCLFMAAQPLAAQQAEPLTVSDAHFQRGGADCLMLGVSADSSLWFLSPDSVTLGLDSLKAQSIGLLRLPLTAPAIPLFSLVASQCSERAIALIAAVSDDLLADYFDALIPILQRAKNLVSIEVAGEVDEGRWNRLRTALPAVLLSGRHEGADYVTLPLNPMQRGWTSRGSLGEALGSVYLKTQRLVFNEQRSILSDGKPIVLGPVVYPRDHMFASPGSTTIRRDALIDYLRQMCYPLHVDHAQIAGIIVGQWQPGPTGSSWATLYATDTTLEKLREESH